jgi:hypothetical protein
VKHILFITTLLLGWTSTAFGQNGSETYFLYLSQNLQIDDFKASTLPSTCNQETQAIYSLSKNLYTHIQSMGSSGCPMTVTITYGDKPLRQQTFDKGPKREQSKITGTLDLYAQNTCTQKYVEASWSITQSVDQSTSCKAATYINGTHVVDQNSATCQLSTYLNDQKDWLKQILAEKLQ